MNPHESNNKFAWRCDIWKDTKERSLDQFKHIVPPESTKYKWNLEIERELKQGKRDRGFKTITMLVDSDTIDAAVFVKREKGYNPALLNMADHIYPGGCVGIGSGAQEENLFRRSNYFRTLNTEGYNRGRLYPMQPDELIYSPEVLVFRENENKGYPIMQQSIGLAMIACAAISKPVYDYKRQRLYTKEYELTKKKIQLIFETAYQNGHDSLVLSALGCGAFANPASHIAEIFKEVIEEYAGCFKVVVFAIIDQNGVNARKYDDMYTTKNNFSLDGPPRDNFSVFKRVLS